MVIGAFVPLALLVVILGSVGCRLVILWRRTRAIPEMSLGFGLVTISLSMPLAAVGRVPATAMEPLGRVCFGAGLFVAIAGISLIAFFNYWVFRRGSPWGRALLTGICTLLCVSVGYMSVVNWNGASVAEVKAVMRPGTLVVIGTVLGSFAWGAGESLRYWASARRQQRLGLADPVVANRFLLWGVASATSALLMMVIVACVLTGMTILSDPAPLAAIAVCGVIMSASWYLTFFSPERYQRFIRERAAQPVAPG